MNDILKNSFSLLLLSLVGAVALKAQPKPNFVVILIDDAGFADLGCYGGLIPTPNIDKLAQNGVRMSQMYNCARCCPTRASLLTGLYPQQAGVGAMNNDISKKSSKAYQGFLNVNCVTIAEVLKDNGYFTAMAGKWHVGQEYGVTPSNRGFDRSINAPTGGFYYSTAKNAKLFIDGAEIKNDDPRLPKNWYITDVWTKFGLQYIDEASKNKKPFLLYLAHNAPHFPLQAPEEDIALFKDKFPMGWDKTRHEIYDRQLKMNLLGKDYQLTKRSPRIPLWENVDSVQQKRSKFTMEVYAAMIHRLDLGIGRIIDELKLKDLYDNTVIILLSDNGASAEAPTVFGATFKGDIIKPSGQLGQAWAECSDTPFYLYKQNTHEGGISTPLIVSYPTGIPKSQNGKIVHQYGHVVDIMATIVAMSGSKYPVIFNGNPITPMQGVNLFPVWKGEKVVRKEPIIWEHMGNVALRDGKWKIVRERTEKEFELYDMEADRTEINNLALKEPEVLDEMIKKFELMSKKIGVMPIDFGSAPHWYVPVFEY